MHVCRASAYYPPGGFPTLNERRLIGLRKGEVLNEPATRGMSVGDRLVNCSVVSTGSCQQSPGMTSQLRGQKIFHPYSGSLRWIQVPSAQPRHPVTTRSRCNRRGRRYIRRTLRYCSERTPRMWKPPMPSLSCPFEFSGRDARPVKKMTGVKIRDGRTEGKRRW